MYHKFLSFFIAVAVVGTLVPFGTFAPRQAKAGPLEDLAQSLRRALNEAPTTAQQLLLKLLDGVENFLNISKTQVAAKIIWTREQKSRANAKLDEGLAEVSRLRKSAETVDLSSTSALSELKTILSEGRSWWSTYQGELKIVLAEILIENGNKSILIAEKIQAQMTQLAEKLGPEQVVDTTALKNLLIQLDTEIEQSKANMKTAVDYLNKMKSSTRTVDILRYYVSARLEVSKATANLLEDGADVVNEIVTELQRLLEELGDQISDQIKS